MGFRMKIKTDLTGDWKKLEEMPENQITTLVLLRANPPFKLIPGFYKVRDIDYEFDNDSKGLLTITPRKILTIDPAISIPDFVIESLNEVASKSGIPKQQHLRWPLPFQISVLWNSKDGNIAQANITPLRE